MKLPNRVYVECKDAKQREAFINALIKHGFKWHNQTTWTGEAVEKTWAWKTYPTVLVEFDRKYMAGDFKKATTFPLQDVYNKVLGYKEN